MKTQLLAAGLALAGILTVMTPAQSQVAGTTTLSVATFDVTEVAQGWSVKKSILGKTVYNDAGEKVGKVDDLIINPAKNVSFVIIGAGGFLGMGRHDVAIPIAQIVNKDGKIVLPGATKDAVKAMPKFDYASTSITREQFVAKADKDLLAAQSKIADLERKAAAASGEAKTKLDQQLVSLKQELKVASDKLAALKAASVEKWKEFEVDVSKAMERVRASITKATS